MKRLVLAALLTLALVSCKAPQEPVMGGPQVGDVIQIPAIEWHVVDAATMREAYKDAGMEIADHQQLLGFTGTRISDGKHIMYTTPPKYVNDESTLTLGHEVLHVVAGPFHEEVR